MCYQDLFAAGRRKLQQPLLPLARLAQLLRLTGSFPTMAAVLAELPDPLDTGSGSYHRPADLLAPYLPTLEASDFNDSSALPATLYDEQGKPLPAFEAAEAWVGQQILARELEEINSILCGPCSCTLCCTGPDRTMSQELFEIPLSSQERSLFSLPATDSPASRQCTALSEPPLTLGDRPFYELGPGLYRWESGWSLILPRGSSCPHLEDGTGRCRIYPGRPEVCRRPQIFPYLIERAPGLDSSAGLPAYVARRKLLAVWDCPYVRDLKEEIASYAEACGLEPVFKQNKG
ncbi:MAG: YkgJ family cysteine cluster protein [Desulfobacteraceae bacterium]|nr:YkgJ family cysteine cluster protein [Desulfobacteraceae bacterium]